MPSYALLVLAVAAVGVFHTMVPDHWAPISLLARQRAWTLMRTARTAAIAGLGHTLSTLAIGLVVWLAGVVVAERYGHLVSTLSSLALIAFGMWIALVSLRELRAHAGLPETPVLAAAAGTSRSTALLLILGSSPMVEGIPAFFAAGRYGIGALALLSLVFAVSTIATYVLLCITSTAGLRRVSLGRFERYGEVLSGAVIAIVGAAFLFFPVL